MYRHRCTVWALPPDRDEIYSGARQAEPSACCTRGFVEFKSSCRVCQWTLLPSLGAPAKFGMANKSTIRQWWPLALNLLNARFEITHDHAYTHIHNCEDAHTDDTDDVKLAYLGQSADCLSRGCWFDSGKNSKNRELKSTFEHIELPAKPLNYFGPINKININQSNVHACYTHARTHIHTPTCTCLENCVSHDVYVCVGMYGFACVFMCVHACGYACVNIFSHADWCCFFDSIWNSLDTLLEFLLTQLLIDSRSWCTINHQNESTKSFVIFWRVCVCGGGPGLSNQNPFQPHFQPHILVQY